MRWSQTLIPTLREAPQEAEIPSHQLMLRAGLIRKLAGGLYTFLPLGLKALRKIETIIREEMDRAGAIEVLMPALQPRELWEQTGRYSTLGDGMFKIVDRQKRDLVLGPTHEEVITDLATRELNSYRQLPKTFYQIQTKFRDEIRPRFGLMRAKEFIMKDAYSFDADAASLDRSYQSMYDAYVRIFERVGLRVKVVEADTGAMGGSSSHEFMVLADAGEDGIVECTACAYAANLEKAERLPPANSTAPDRGACREVPTPGKRTIEEVAAFLTVKPEALIKTLIYTAGKQAFAVCIPGNRELNEIKLTRLVGAPVQMADDETILKVTGAPVGFAGPVGLKIPVYAELELQSHQQSVTGANKADTHLVDIDITRDAAVEKYADLVNCTEGDACPRCSAPMRAKRGIEVGHVFKLGYKYTQAMGTAYLDETGNRQPVIMGCYGIGVTRTLQAVIEQSHDQDGIIWPGAVAPAVVAILALSPTLPACMDAATALAGQLETQGIDCVLDDRDERPGVKFKDADLVGFPIRVVVSERSLAKGSVEVKLRTEKQAASIALQDAASHILKSTRTLQV